MALISWRCPWLYLERPGRITRQARAIRRGRGGTSSTLRLDPVPTPAGETSGLSRKPSKEILQETDLSRNFEMGQTLLTESPRVGALTGAQGFTAPPTALPIVGAGDPVTATSSTPGGWPQAVLDLDRRYFLRPMMGIP